MRKPDNLQSATEVPSVKMDSASLRCRNCGSTKIRRVHRSGFKDRMRSLANFYPFHCHGCTVRGYYFAETLPTPRASGAAGQSVRQERIKSEKRRLARTVALFAICGAIFAFLARYFVIPAG